MHIYAYDDLDRYTESQSSLDNSAVVAPETLVDGMIILLDEDDDVSDTNISVLERRKIGLPKRIMIRNTVRNVEKSPEQENMVIEQKSIEGEIFQSMSCMLGFRDKSFEVRAVSSLRLTQDF